ncbi:MAG: cob(I)yrinic acid a,c-diamide adenosyltransferase [Bacteroidales bacterium]|nr:cob(I)yrinic acid a,c-diamide adenosyltransferase [Bacteroidales bacterium]HNW72420.1 cob(I)yrinic acid a,c-diamide adenosyltransferase [Bacteroidales bacterium]HPS49455.1 cob(I)yrinic acid a,c-diamide adenosyltransferase [Bacteroidales bacterium]
MEEEFKIYTKGGDRGETSLLGGTRVAKSHERVEAYGNLDELNSFIGLIRDQDIRPHYKEILIRIQENLFIAEALVARDPDKPARTLPVLSDQEITLLEREIDAMNEELAPLRNFILPGGHPVVSICHIARTVCRRAERSLIRLKATSPVDEIILRLINRLSDYLFVLARKVAKDLGATETAWEPGKSGK